MSAQPARAAAQPASANIQAGAVLTRVGGRIIATDYQRTFVAYTEDGTLYFSPSHQQDPHVLSLISKIERLPEFPIRQRVPADIKLIAQIYERDKAATTPAGLRVEGSDTRMQRDVLQLLAEMSQRGVSDIRIKIFPHSAPVEIRLNGTKMPFKEWATDYARAFCASAFTLTDVSDSTYKPNEHQQARISPQTAALPASLAGVRLQYNPMAWDGRELVMRLLYQDRMAGKDLASLGYSECHLNLLATIRSIPIGMNIFSGPTGSGKSSSLHLMLSSLMRETNNERAVITLEDPPEAPLHGATQIPIANAHTPEERDIAFTKGIIAVLRSDPDIIMIGEIRDPQSASLAVQAAMSGHAVYTSLHTNGALAIIDRLKDLGVEDYKLYDPTIVTGLISQRLISTLCPHCRRRGIRSDVSSDLAGRLTRLGLDPRELHFAGPGCKHCLNGRAGRTVAAEIILPDETLLSLLRDGRKPDARAYAHPHRDDTMAGHALGKIAAGLVDARDAEAILGPLDRGLPQ